MFLIDWFVNSLCKVAVTRSHLLQNRKMPIQNWKRKAKVGNVIWIKIILVQNYEIAYRLFTVPYPRTFCTLPSFARIKWPRWRPLELNDRHLRSHGKLGYCEILVTKLSKHLHRLLNNVTWATSINTWDDITFHSLNHACYKVEHSLVTLNKISWKRTKETHFSPRKHNYTSIA